MKLSENYGSLTQTFLKRSTSFIISCFYKHAKDKSHSIYGMIFLFSTTTGPQYYLLLKMKVHLTVLKDKKETTRFCDGLKA